ncbi:Protein N-acetyltransferase, RimJ/RimL family [Mucilaginibacter pineti]|uniref:Protein N-acetyltransferase, RimJ/RimL family n=1 Tax=Mucilaginibacter pineti TaxID=1391627 RepID=A0A1G7EJI0_9SPHI|nr:GNAT family N-acetyltransferase [Mucilaginibacter pineti]SDE63605.1 Protein N-acetyltransferase, RimJ/RimL family [Mucilaginibacter pineti]
MLDPLYLETRQLRLNPIDAAELLRYRDLITEVFELFSDAETLHFIPEKKLNHLAEAEQWLKAAILSAHSGRNVIHLITDKSSGRLAGIVDIIPPAVAREHYRLGYYPFFIEFYLKAEYKGKTLMSKLLPKILQALEAQGIPKVAAVVNRRNYAASKLLAKCGFHYREPFDVLQDFYEFTQVA